MNAYSNSPELDKRGKDHVFRSDWVSTALVPRRRVLDQVILKMMVEYQDIRRKRTKVAGSYLWQHPLPTSLHAQAAIMHPQDEISSLLVSALSQVKLGLIRRRGGEVSVQAELDGHAAGLSE